MLLHAAQLQRANPIMHYTDTDMRMPKYAQPAICHDRVFAI